MPLSLAHQARVLRRLTGVSLERARRAVEAAQVRRRTRAREEREQLLLEEQRASDAEVREGFARCRRILAGGE